MSSTKPWWRETVVYQIYPRSFQDSSGDGVGDLQGVISRLDYLAGLGVETIWLSPFYRSPQRDFGYDISDYRSIAPEYGDMATCERLIEEVHRRALRIVFDMVLNHTSDQHPWFLESRSSRSAPKRDWYIWRDGRRPGGAAPPNNWRSMIGGSGWHYDRKTEQWYWAQFLPFQPDLNYRNPEVREEMLGTLRFWLDKGVDGFRLDIVNALFEDEELRDNPFAWTLFPSDDDPSMFFQGSQHTLNHPDTLAFMGELRAAVDAYEPPRFLVGEVNAPIEMARAHCGETGEGLNLVFLFRSLTTALNAPAMRAVIEEYERLFPEPLLPTWVFSNHDRARRITRLEGSPAQARLNLLWQLSARGVPFLYYGEELGMLQPRIPLSRSQDELALRLKWLPQLVVEGLRRFTGESLNRDECRGPMQWCPGPGVGFCPEEVTPWLPPPADTRGRSVQEQQGRPSSTLECCRRLLALRRQAPALRRGALQLLPAMVTGPRVLGYWRSCPEQRLLVLMNASPTQQRLPHPAPESVFLGGTQPVPPSSRGAELLLRPWEGGIWELPPT